MRATARLPPETDTSVAAEPHSEGPQRPPDRPEPSEVEVRREATYRIRIKGQLGPEWSSWFAGLSVHAEPAGTTLLTGEVTDQAALHGILVAIRDLGLPLISVETVVTPPPESTHGG